MTLPKLYLCGGINGLSDSACRDWRAAVKRELVGVYACLDPMRQDYRDREDANVDEIIAGDEADIDECDVLLATADRASWGTGMEIRDAFKWKKKHVVVVCGQDRISPWLRGNSHVLLPVLAMAVAYLKDYAAKFQGGAQ
jgi:hypothetical protein